MKYTFAVLAGLLLAAWALNPPEVQAHQITLKQCIKRAVKSSSTRGQFVKRVRRCKRVAFKHHVWHSCRPGRRPLVLMPITVKHRKANQHQRKVITWTLQEGRKMKVSRKSLISSVATLTQESSATNLRGGHGTSVGPMQLINIHGPVRRRRNIRWVARWYFRQAKNINHHRPRIKIGSLSQAVQRSAHPHAYNQWVGEAKRTVNRFLGPCSAS